MTSYRIADRHALMFFTCVYAAHVAVQKQFESPPPAQTTADREHPDLPGVIEELAEGLAHLDPPRVITGRGHVIAPAPVVSARGTVTRAAKATADSAREDEIDRATD